MTSTSQQRVPEHVALIMDGNRRWAKERELPTLEGHRVGYEKMKEVPEWFFDRGVKIVSVYAFSMENWKRTKTEVSYLMRLLKMALKKDLKTFHAKGYRVLLSGRVDELPADLPQLCVSAEEKTKHNTRGVLNICINYGGRAEMIDAVKRIVKMKMKPEQITEEVVSSALYHAELPDPDLIVRTSGEERLSGFLLWRSAYSELLFLKKYWPDFEARDVKEVLREYARRQRRFGGDGK